MPDVPPEPKETLMRNLGSPDESESDLKPEYDASWAVVVGINNYQHVPKLSFAVDDAAGMASLLIGRLGFQRDKVLVLLDPPPAGPLPFDLVGGEASNTAIEELHVYFTQFAPGGRLEVGPLLTSTTDIIFTGLEAGEEATSDSFPVAARRELVETRIFAVPDHFRQLITPPAFNARAIAILDEPAHEKLKLFQRATVWYRTVVSVQPSARDNG